MLSATSFTYDGIPSAQYGLTIASLDADPMSETTYLAPSVTAVKSKKSNRFFYASASYDDLPTYSFTILRDNQLAGVDAVINDKDRREILGWLIGRKGFKELIIPQDDRMIYRYRCIFTEVDILYHGGYCIGFTVTAMFDSPFCYAEKSSGVRTSNGSDYVSYVVDNTDSDLWDDYSYPVIKFTPTGYVDEDKTIMAYNSTDDESGNRMFYFTDGSLNNEVVVDNDLKIITGVGANVQRFSKKWLRLRRGMNTIKVKIKGQFEIINTSYMKMGF